jgi:hypothetical protein
MNFRLLLDIEVVEFIATLPRREQIRLRKRLGEIQATPTRFADFLKPGPDGRSLDVHIHCGFAIYYWEDIADRHIKVLRIRRADA